MRFMLRVMLRAMFALTTMLVVFPAHAEPDCRPLRDLITIPEIKSQSGRLQGVVTLSDEERSLAGSATGSPCEQEDALRFFKGYSTQGPEKPWPSTGDPIPGPTLRARVGDLVQLAFLNQVDPEEIPEKPGPGPGPGERGHNRGLRAREASAQSPPGKAGREPPDLSAE